MSILSSSPFENPPPATSLESPDPSKPKLAEAMYSLLNLPEEVHDEIFLKLPAESVLSSRCVCKHFYNLLRKPKLLFGHSSQEESPNSLGNTPTLMIYSVPIDFDSISPTQECEPKGAVVLNYPFDSGKMCRQGFLGSANGLICFKNYSFRRAGLPSYSYEHNFCILNPLTGEYKDFKLHKEFKLPRDSVRDRYDYGFGYDSNIDDYKLVVMDYDKPLEIDVYTLKSDTWTSIQKDNHYSLYRGEDSCAVFSNGCLHWLVSGTVMFTEVIVSFDVSNETIVDMPVPEDINPPTDYFGSVDRNIGVRGDCLCIACIWEPDRVDVWVMEEYGVEKSWSKRFATTIKLLGSSNPYWKPLWCFDNGEILVDNGGEQLRLCDPRNGRVRSVVVSGITMDGNRESYVESLVMQY